MNAELDQQQQQDTEDVFDVIPDVEADKQVTQLEKDAKKGQSQQGGQQQQQQGQQQQDDTLPEGVRKDEASGRRFIMESGRKVWLDDKPAAEGEVEGAQGKQQGGQQQQQQVEAPKSVTLDPAALEQVVKSVVAGVQPQQQQQIAAPQKPLTPEEEDKLMQRWKPTKEWTGKLMNPDTVLEAVTEMRDGLIKEAMTASKYITEMYVGELQPVIQPLSEHVKQTQITQWRNDFFSKYKVLEPYESLLDMVVKAKTADGKWKPASRDKGFEEIAADVEKVLKTQDPKFSLTNAPSQQQQKGQGQQNGNGQQQTNRTQNRMSRTSTGGGAGAGGGSKTIQSADKKLDGGIWE